MRRTSIYVISRVKEGIGNNWKKKKKKKRMIRKKLGGFPKRS